MNVGKHPPWKTPTFIVFDLLTYLLIFGDYPVTADRADTRGDRFGGRCNDSATKTPPGPTDYNVSSRPAK